MHQLRSHNSHAVFKLDLEYFGEHRRIPEQDALKLCHPSLACARNYSSIHQSSCSQDNLRLHRQGPWTKVALGSLLLHDLGTQQEEPEPEISNCQQKGTTDEKK